MARAASAVRALWVFLAALVADIDKINVVVGVGENHSVFEFHRLLPVGCLSNLGVDYTFPVLLSIPETYFFLRQFTVSRVTKGLDGVGYSW